MKLTNETKIGVMVSIVILLLVGLVIKAGDFKFQKKGYMIKVHFFNVDGVNTNSPVMLNGFEVGHVKTIDILDDQDGTKMVLNVWLREEVKIRQGAKAYVKNMGFLGEKYVGLTSGEGGNPLLQTNEIIVGREPADLDRLMADGQEIAKNIKEISDNINQRLSVNQEKFDSSVSNLDKTLTHWSSISSSLDERVTINAQKIDDLLTYLRAAAVNLDQMTYDLKQNPWKLLYRTKEEKLNNALRTREDK